MRRISDAGFVNATILFFLAVVLVVEGGACSGEQGLPGVAGKNLVTRTIDVAAGEQCASGGQQIDLGADDDEDGMLGDDEVDFTAFVCNGTDGLSVQADVEEPGPNCAEGGVKVVVGEQVPVYLCSGTPGEVGSDGQSVTLTPSPLGNFVLTVG